MTDVEMDTPAGDVIMMKMTITAVGEVRDSDGNLISSEPMEFTQDVTEEEAKAILASMNEEGN